jgi:hypothetical protein
MAQLKLETSVAVITAIAEMLNTEIRKTGEIKINNPVIWEGYLHQMHNEDWRGVLTTMNELAEGCPQLFTISNLQAIRDGIELLDKFDQYYDRVMDMRNRHVSAKKTAWKCIMSMREVYCKARGIYLPNSDESRTTTSFNDIFGEME